MTLYDVLGMPAGASHADLRRAYLRAARRTHPDVHATADPSTRLTAEAQMRTLNAAWSVLSDPERRRAYDRQLTASWPRTATGAPNTWAAPAPAAAPGTGAGFGSGWPTAASPRMYRGWPDPPPRPTGSATGSGSRASAPSTASSAASSAGSAGADWRRFASPGPAPHRTLGARLATMIPVLLVALALAAASLGVLMGSSSLLALAGSAVSAAALGFLAAPILAMRESRRHQRRPARRAAAVSGLGGRAGS